MNQIFLIASVWKVLESDKNNICNNKSYLIFYLYNIIIFYIKNFIKLKVAKIINFYYLF